MINVSVNWLHSKVQIVGIEIVLFSVEQINNSLRCAVLAVHYKNCVFEITKIIQQIFKNNICKLWMIFNIIQIHEVFSAL